jgi:FtsZ-binding cell division protein ZapB
MDNYVQYVLEVEELKKEIAKLKKRVQEAEGEVTIIRGIGMNSPEFRALKKENEELKEDNQKLAEQISDKNNFVEKLRGKGLI